MRHGLLVLMSAVAIAVGFIACGSRTSILDWHDRDGAIDESSAPDVDQDVGNDVGDEVAEHDGGNDAPDGADSLDAADVLDSQADHDETSSPTCTDASAPVIYLLTDDQNILEFDPQTTAVTHVTSFSCAGTSGAQPFGMTIDRHSTAYISFYLGGGPGIYKVNLTTGACTATSYVSNGIGAAVAFSADDGGATDSLYLLKVGNTQTESPGSLGTIDLATMSFHLLGSVAPIVWSDITGTSDGKLFAFYVLDPHNFGTTNYSIAELNKQTGAILNDTTVPGVAGADGFAFGYLDGYFWLFTSQNGLNATITRFDRANQTTSVVGSVAAVIVGAGVATCAH